MPLCWIPGPVAGRRGAPRWRPFREPFARSPYIFLGLRWAGPRACTGKSSERHPTPWLVASLTATHCFPRPRHALAACGAVPRSWQQSLERGPSSRSPTWCRRSISRESGPHAARMGGLPRWAGACQEPVPRNAPRVGTQSWSMRRHTAPDGMSQPRRCRRPGLALKGTKSTRWTLYAPNPAALPSGLLCQTKASTLKGATACRPCSG